MFFLGLIGRGATRRLEKRAEHSGDIHDDLRLHQTVTLADLLRELKSGSASWARRERVFPDFLGWQKEYGAFSWPYSDLGDVENYIRNPARAPQARVFVEELRRLLCDEGVDFDERYLT